MFQKRFRNFAFVSALTMGTISIVGEQSNWAQPPASPPPAAPAVAPLAETDGQVLARGPVHEAFAEAIVFDPKPGLVVARQPPPVIDELPPDQRPDGANVQWIPGYWAWDEDESDFIWLSGLWRDVPLGQQWVTGYWNRVDDGFQWISGYWGSAAATEVQYLPEPPESLENGPNVPAASADFFWVPGYWSWTSNNYSWRAGYWSAGSAGWVWVPAHYVWTPRGYVFVGGYWDYPVAQRGVLFAPVHFSSRVYTQTSYRYSPSIVMNTSLLTTHLFLRPSYSHYYFGDYYGNKYAHMGIQPWYTFHNHRQCYDPIYSYARWQNVRKDHDWEHRVKDHYEHYHRNEGDRPPRHFADVKDFHGRDFDGRKNNLPFATSLEQFAKRPDHSTHFKPVDKSERQAIVDRTMDMKKFRDERQQIETKRPNTNLPLNAKITEPLKINLPKSPVASRTAEEMRRHETRRENFQDPRRNDPATSRDNSPNNPLKTPFSNQTRPPVTTNNPSSVRPPISSKNTNTTMVRPPVDVPNNPLTPRVNLPKDRDDDRNDNDRRDNDKPRFPNNQPRQPFNNPNVTEPRQPFNNPSNNAPRQPMANPSVQPRQPMNVPNNNIVKPPINVPNNSQIKIPMNNPNRNPNINPGNNPGQRPQAQPQRNDRRPEPRSDRPPQNSQNDNRSRSDNEKGKNRSKD